MAHPVQLPAFEQDTVVAVCPVAAYADAQHVVLESWDASRRRIVWLVGTVAEDPSTGYLTLGPSVHFDALADALRAFAVALLEGGKA